jgi:hypothetical protein
MIDQIVAKLLLGGRYREALLAAYAAFPNFEIAPDLQKQVGPALAACGWSSRFCGLQHVHLEPGQRPQPPPPNPTPQQRDDWDNQVWRCQPEQQMLRELVDFLVSEGKGSEAEILARLRTLSPVRS